MSALGHGLTDSVSSDSFSVALRVCISFSWDCLSSEKVKTEQNISEHER